MGNLTISIHVEIACVMLKLCVFVHTGTVFLDAFGEFDASKLFENETLPWVVLEHSNIEAYKNHYSALEKSSHSFPPAGRHFPLVVTDGLIKTA